MTERDEPFVGSRRRLTLLAACTIIPLQILLMFGFTFTSPKNISSWLWAFVWFTFILNIPAILISWSLPKLGAYWVLLNTAVSVSIAAGFLLHRYVEGRNFGDGLLTALGVLAARAFIMALFLWAPQLAFAGAMLYRLRSRDLERNTELI